MQRTTAYFQSKCRHFALYINKTIPNTPRVLRALITTFTKPWCFRIAAIEGLRVSHENVHCFNFTTLPRTTTARKGIGVRIRDWATRDLRSGDLSALATIAQGGSERDQERIRRLTQRGFLASKVDGTLAITPFGRLALFIRQFSF